MNEFIPNKLPLQQDIETKEILKKSILANSALAELKGVSNIIPNSNILINSLALQEAKDSSEIENIITTHDELYKASLFGNYINSPDAKEVRDYSLALRTGFTKVRAQQIIRLGDILESQEELEKNKAGLRKLPSKLLFSPALRQKFRSP